MKELRVYYKNIKREINKMKKYSEKNLINSGENVFQQWQTLFSWAPKSLQMMTAAMKLKDACSLEEKLWPT